MKLTTIVAALAAALALAAPVSARSVAGDSLSVKDLKVERSENKLFVSMSLDGTGMKLKSDKEIVYMPVLTFGERRLDLPRVIVAGRNRYIQHRRHGDLSGGALLCRPGRVIEYSALVPYEPWMETAALALAEDVCGCGFRTVDSNSRGLATLDFTPKVFVPEYAFITPVAGELKMREAHGSAYIDFPVNRTEIAPEYRRNPEELRKIRETIDVVRNDADSRITAIEVKGFASPEGSYANNERLAKGRTESLIAYVRGLYAFDPSVMRSSWEAENWEGLRKYVAESALEEKEGLLAVIDRTDLAPDAREWKLKSSYPKQYRELLQHVYPALRRSDYTVHYVVRSFTTVEEIREVMKSAPQKLSLHEMKVLAESLEPGSEEYREVFEVAVRMYPEDPVANLNAANIALGRDELERAAAYLAKAGDAPEATYARGILAAKGEEYAEAVRLFEEAGKAGVKQATEAIAQLRKLGLIE